MKNRTVFLVFIVLLGFLAFIYWIKQESRPITGPIRIGFASSLSGSAAVWGTSVQKGFNFGIGEINRHGGVNGRPIVVATEDDKCEAAAGASAFEKLMAVDRVKIITGSVCSSVAMAVAPKTQGARVLYVASGATDPAVPKQGDLIFRLWVSDAYEATTLGRAATTELGLRTFAIGYVDDNPAGASLKNNFSTAVESAGGQVLAVESYSSKQQDFRTGVAKLLATKSQALYLITTPEQTPAIINQARALGFTGPILAYSPSITAAGVAAKINDQHNIYYATPVDKKETDFWQRYASSTGTEADSLVALGYDSARIIAAGLKRCGENNNCIRDYYLQLKNYPLARGPLTFDADGDITGVQFEFKRLK